MSSPSPTVSKDVLVARQIQQLISATDNATASALTFCKSQCVLRLAGSQLQCILTSEIFCLFCIDLHFYEKLEIRSVEHGICPIAEFTSPLLSCAAILAIRP